MRLHEWQRGERAARALEPLRDRFAGQTAVVIASGPTAEKTWAGRAVPNPIIAVNDGYALAAPDIIFAHDAAWWMARPEARSLPCLKLVYGASAFSEVVPVQGTGALGYESRLGYVRHGHNSGHVGVLLAAQLGARRIVLVGFDMRKVDGRSHYFGEHHHQLRMLPNYELWVKRFKPLADDLKAAGVEVLNATPGSALRWFDEVDLDGVLATASQPAA